jgi:transcriptional regulator with XRE-family HTH domain
MSDALAQAVAAEIRAEKGRQRVSGRELARRIELPTTTVSRWLRGDTALGLDELDKIAAALEVDMVDIIRAAQIRVKLPRMDSNHQPAGSMSDLVSAAFGGELGAEILPFAKPIPHLPRRPVCTRPGGGSGEYPLLKVG